MPQGARFAAPVGPVQCLDCVITIRGRLQQPQLVKDKATKGSAPLGKQFHLAEFWLRNRKGEWGGGGGDGHDCSLGLVVQQGLLLGLVTGL